MIYRWPKGGREVDISIAEGMLVAEVDGQREVDSREVNISMAKRRKKD